MNNGIHEIVSSLNKSAVIPLIIIIMSCLCFAAMGIDKSLAKAGARRIPEKTLFTLALFGGAAGGLLGMYTFRHKTKHTSFKVGMPLLLAFNIVLCIFVLRLF